MDEKKISILLAAEKLFAVQGIPETRMEDIARAMGMSKKTLYIHFKSKDKLVELVYSRKLEDFSVNLDRIVESNDLILNKVLDYLDSAFEKLDNVTPIVLFHLRKHYPKMVKMIDEYISDATFRRIRQLLNELKTDGYLEEGVSIDSLLLLYRNNINNFLMNQFSIDSSQSENQEYQKYLFCQSIITLFRGLLNQSALTRFNEEIKDHKRLNIYYQSV